MISLVKAVLRPQSPPTELLMAAGRQVFLAKMLLEAWRIYSSQPTTWSLFCLVFSALGWRGLQGEPPPPERLALVAVMPTVFIVLNSAAAFFCLVIGRGGGTIAVTLVALGLAYAQVRVGYSNNKGGGASYK